MASSGTGSGTGKRSWTYQRFTSSCASHLQAGVEERELYRHLALVLFVDIFWVFLTILFLPFYVLWTLWGYRKAAILLFKR